MSSHKRALHRQRKAQKGNALLFALLGLVIAGVVVAIGVQIYQDSERSAAIQEVTGQVNTIVGKSKENFSQYSFAQVSTTVAIGSRVIPAALHLNPTTAQNKYGGTVTLVDNNAETPATAKLTYQQVPQDQCVAIINGTHGIARRVTVDGADVKPLDGVVDVAQLNTRCTAADRVALSWVIGRT